MKKLAIALAGALLLSACGGGGDEDSGRTGKVYTSCGNTPNYAARVGGVRWRQFPLTVFIDMTRAPRGTDINVVIQGMAGWSAAGYGLGSFSLVDTPNNADIILRFGDAAAEARQRGQNPPAGLAGVVFYARESNEIGAYITKGTTILLDAVLLQNYMNFMPSQYEGLLRSLVLHETGHAFFSFGHPLETGLVMSADGVSPYETMPTVVDINTFREVYCKP